MSVIKEQIQDAPAMQSSGGTSDGSPQPARRTGTTVGDSLASALDMERAEAELWLNVAQLVVLYLIWRELRGGP